MEVNIYADTTIKRPSKGKGSSMYLIECIISGRTETREGISFLPEATEDASILAALIKALIQFNKPCEMKIFTKCSGVFNALDTKRALEYREKDFTSSRNVPIKNAALWDILLELLQKHTWTVTEEDHSYMTYMESALRKAHKDKAGASKG